MRKKEIKEVDMYVLRVINKFDLIDSESLAKWLKCSENSARNRLNKLKDKKLLGKFRLLVDYANMYKLTRKAKRLLADESSEFKEKLSSIRHVIEVMKVATEFAWQHSVQIENIKVDKEIRRINFSGHIPDLIVNENVALEIEITPKSKSRLARNLEFNDQNYQLQIWYCDPLTNKHIREFKNNYVYQNHIYIVEVQNYALS